MKKLKTILQSRYTYFILILFILVYVFIIVFCIKRESIYSISYKMFYGKINNYYIVDTYLSMEISSEEKIKCTYYFKDENEKNKFILKYKFGDYIKLTGSLTQPLNNTNPNQFNYKKYLYYQKIYYILEIDKYEKIKDNSNYLFKIKNYINDKINNYDDISKNYLKAFLLGNNKEIDANIRNSYQKIGISHLLAISGMHISVFTSIIYFIFKKFNIDGTFITIVFLIIYILITNFSPGVLRASISFILNIFNKKIKFNLNSINILIITIFLILLFNPFYICNLGFIFSFLISFYLISFSSIIKKCNNYFTKLFSISFISFLASFPLVIYISYEINLFSVLYNIILVPYVSIILFPLSLLVFILPFLSKIYVISIVIFEYLVNIFNSIPSTLILKKSNILVLTSYFIIVTLILYKIKYNKKKHIIILIIIVFFHYNYNLFFQNNYLIMLDVKQGDSILLHSNNETILIDTGNINLDSLINTIKSLGIKKIEYLILTHGDFDHLGSSIDIVKNLKVENVIFNNDEYNELESKLIKVLQKKKIKYYKNLKEINSNNKLYFLNTIKYDNENDNSNVIYFNYNSFKFLFMGDASIKREKDIINKYNLTNIDFLKIGHHGSDTSTSKYFIDRVNPKNCLISVGKNNKYNHPKQEVLDILKNCNIYRTDINGGVEIKLYKDKYFIKTYGP